MRKRKEKKGKKEQREKKNRREKKEEKEERERKDFPGFRWSTFDSSSTKVGARSGIYVWTPKSWSFDKLQEVGYFPTWFTFILKTL